MRYKEQMSTDEGTTWNDTGATFKSRKEVAAHINKAITPYSSLDWRAGDYWVLRYKDGICPHFKIVKA